MSGKAGGCSQRELIALVRQLASEGLRDHEIAADLGLHIDIVRRWLGTHENA